ncbi:hypothetical protein BJ508DRAFT_300787 [Ascobolus immersus RN42]|uniref:Uncharacterized protein n=1 Tax=Ascobolus immersus RN42 TaxID=1160509 RepID=A0A3N4IP56_ASCIM|nr:hypothetical protein BJ508DRAFT_300787 [Ascobolus immersus RN42]
MSISERLPSQTSATSSQTMPYPKSITTSIFDILARASHGDAHEAPNSDNESAHFFHTIPRIVRCVACGQDSLIPSRTIVNPTTNQRAQELRPGGGPRWVTACENCLEKQRVTSRRKGKGKRRGKVLELVPELGFITSFAGIKSRKIDEEVVEEVGEEDAGKS